MSDLEINSVSFISISHLRDETLGKLIELDIVSDDLYGIQFYIGDGNIDNELNKEILACGYELEAILNYFAGKVKYIRFDRDCGIVEGLDTFDW